MNRRRLLEAVTSASIVGTAGCLQGGQSQQPSASRDLGSAIIRDSVKVGVVGYTTIRQYATFDRAVPRESQSFSREDFETPPTPGAQYLLVFLFVEHQGSTRQYFPSGQDDTRLFYGGDQVAQFYPPYVFTNGAREFASYYGAITHEGAKSNGAFPPFGATGYMLFEVPKTFDASLVELEITWGWEKPGNRLQGGATTTWGLLPENRNTTAGEPPTSQSHQGRVTTRTQEYSTTNDETITAWDTVTVENVDSDPEAPADTERGLNGGAFIVDSGHSAKET